MNNLGNWNLGSVGEVVLSMIDNVPVAISGVQLNNIADRNRQFVQNYTGVVIDSSNIDIAYQNVILYRTISDTAMVMNSLGADTSSISLGDFSTSKGGETNLVKVSQNFKEMADKEIKELGRKVRYYKAFGAILGIIILPNLILNLKW